MPFKNCNLTDVFCWEISESYDFLYNRVNLNEYQKSRLKNLSSLYKKKQFLMF